MAYCLKFIKGDDLKIYLKYINYENKNEVNVIRSYSGFPLFELMEKNVSVANWYQINDTNEEVDG